MKHSILKWSLLLALILAVSACFGMSALAEGGEPDPLDLSVLVEDQQGEQVQATSVQTFESIKVRFAVPEGTTAARVVASLGEEARYTPVFDADWLAEYSSGGYAEWPTALNAEGSWTIYAQVYVGQTPDTVDWDDETDPDVTTSSSWSIEATADGDTDPAAVSGISEDDTITRGNFVELTVSFGAEDNTEFVDLWITKDVDGGDPDYVYSDWVSRAENDDPVTFSIGTASFTPGNYSLHVFSYAVGKNSDEAEIPFAVEERDGLAKHDIYFATNLQPEDDDFINVMSNRPFRLSGYAPEAVYMQLAVIGVGDDHEDMENYETREGLHADCCDWEIDLDESGEYEVYLWAYYHDENGEDELDEDNERRIYWSEPIRFRVISDGALDRCAIEGPTLAPLNEDYCFTVNGLNQTLEWDEPFEDYWWDVDIYDEDMDEETLESRDWDNCVWHCERREAPEDWDGMSFAVPTSDNPLFVSGHRYRLAVWVDAWGMDGAHNDMNLYFYDPSEVSDDVVLTCDAEFNDEAGAYCLAVRDEVNFRVEACATNDHGPATAFLEFNGCEWFPIGPADEEGVYEWSEEMDRENTCYAVMACYQDLSDYWNDDEFDMERFKREWENNESDIEFTAYSNVLPMRIDAWGTAPEAYADVFWMPEDDDWDSNPINHDITRGELLTVMLYGYEEKYDEYETDENGDTVPVGDPLVPTHWRAYIEDAHGDQVGEEWDEYFENGNVEGFTFILPTAMIEAGDGYRVVIETGMRGHDWTGRESVPFSIVDPQGERPVLLNFNKAVDYETNSISLVEGEELEYAIYAPAAYAVEIHWRNKLNANDDWDYIDRWDGTEDVWDCISGEEGEYEIQATADYPSVDGDNPDALTTEYSDLYTVYITSTGILSDPKISDLPALIDLDGENGADSLNFTLLVDEHTERCKIELFWLGPDGEWDDGDRVFRENLENDGEVFQWNEEEIGYNINASIPWNDGFMNRGEGVYQLRVRTNAFGYHSSETESRFVVARPGDDSDVVLTISKEFYNEQTEQNETIEATEGDFFVYAFEDFHVAVNAANAQAVRIYDGDGWREFWNDENEETDGFQVEFNESHGGGSYSWFAQGLYNVPWTEEDGEDARLLDENGEPIIEDGHFLTSRWLYTSNAVRVVSTIESRLEEPELEFYSDVTRGEYLGVTIAPVDGAEWYDLHVYAMHEDGRRDDLIHLGGLDDGMVQVPTARLEPGYYYIAGYAKAVGYESSDISAPRRYRFQVNAPEEGYEPEDGVYFSVSNPNPATCERIFGSGYVPGAVKLRVITGGNEDDSWGEWDDDAFEATGWYFSDDGMQSLTLQAIYAERDDEGRIIWDSVDWEAWQTVGTIWVDVYAEYEFHPEKYEIPTSIDYGEPFVLYPCATDGEEENTYSITAFQAHLSVMDRDFNCIFDEWGTGFTVPADCFEENALYRVELELFGLNYRPLRMRCDMFVQGENAVSDDVTIDVSDENPLINQEFLINAHVGEDYNAIRLFMGNDCRYFLGRDADNQRYSIGEDGRYIAYAQAGTIKNEDINPDFIDWDEWDWDEWDWNNDVEWGPVSRLVAINVPVGEITGEPHIELGANEVSRGEYLRVDLVPPWARSALYYDLHIRDSNEQDVCYRDEEGNYNGDEIFYARYYAKDADMYLDEDETIHTFMVPTLDYEPGDYRVVVCAGGQTGYYWCDSNWEDGAFTITEPAEEPEPIFALSSAEVQVDERFNVTIFAPGALALRLICDMTADVAPDGDVDCWSDVEGDSFCGMHSFGFDSLNDSDEDGNVENTTHTFTAWGLFPVSEESDDTEWRQVGTAVGITVLAPDEDHWLPEPEIQLSKGLYSPGEAVSFTIGAIPHAQGYHVWVERMRDGERFYDQELSPDAFWAFYDFGDDGTARYNELHMELPTYWFNEKEGYLVGCEAHPETGYMGSESQQGFSILPMGEEIEYDENIQFFIDAPGDGVPIYQDIGVRVEAQNANEAFLICGEDIYLEPSQEEEGVFTGCFSIGQVGRFPVYVLVYGEDDSVRWTGPCTINTFAYGWTDLPELGAPETVVQGEFLPLSIGRSWNANWYDVRVINEEGEWAFPRSMHYESWPGTIGIPTLMLEPGEYRIEVGVGGVPGYRHNCTDANACRFTVTAREDGEDEGYFRISKTDLDIYEEFTFAIHDPSEDDGCTTWKLFRDDMEWIMGEGFCDGLNDTGYPLFFDESTVPEGEDSATHTLHVEVCHYEEEEYGEVVENWTQVGESVEVTVYKRGELDQAWIETTPETGIDGEDIMVTIHAVENADRCHVELRYDYPVGSDVYHRADYRSLDFENGEGAISFSFTPDYTGTFVVECRAEADRGYVPSDSMKAIPVISGDTQPADEDHPIEVTLSKNPALIFENIRLEAHAEGAKYIRFVTPENEQRDNEPDWDDPESSTVNDYLSADFHVNRSGVFPIFVEAVYDVNGDEARYISKLQDLEIIRLGQAGIPDLEVQEAVTRGEMMYIAFSEVPNANHYDVYFYAVDGDDDYGNDNECYHAGFNAPGEYDLPTVFLEEGMYRVQVSCGGLNGYDWSSTDPNDGWFNVYEPADGLGDAWFRLSGLDYPEEEGELPTLPVNRALTFAAYAGEATHITIAVDGEMFGPSDDVTYISYGNDQLSFNWPDGDGESHTIAAFYTTDNSEDGDWQTFQWIQIDEYAFRVVEYDPGMDIPVVNAPTSVIAGETFRVTVPLVEHANGYDLSIMPDGTCDSWFDWHMSPEEANEDGVLVFPEISTADWPVGIYNITVCAGSSDVGYASREGHTTFAVNLIVDGEHMVDIWRTDNDELWSNKDFEISVYASDATALCLYLGEGQVHYRLGDAFTESFSLNQPGPACAFVKACYEPFGDIDVSLADNDFWESLNWIATSDVLRLYINSMGQVVSPEITVDESVRRGELLTVTVGDDDDENPIQWFDLHIRNSDHNDCFYRRCGQSGTYQLPTGNLIPGEEYYVVVSVGRERYEWNDSKHVYFEVTEPQAQGDLFNLSAATLTAGSRLDYSIYLPDAQEFRLVAVDNDGYYRDWYYGGDSVADGFEWWDIGTFTLRVEAKYSDDGEWTEKLSRTLTVNPIGTLTFPNQTWSKVVYQGDQMTVSFNAVDHAEYYLVGIINPADFGQEDGPWCIQYDVQPGQQTISDSQYLASGVTYIVGVDPWANGWVLPDIEQAPVHRVAVVDPNSVLTLPAAMTTVEEEAFAGVSAQMIVLPQGVTSIGSHAFADCPNLVAVINPSGASIPENAFYGCDHEVVVADHIGF